MPELFSREPNLTRIWVDRQMNKIPPFDSAQLVKMCTNYFFTIYTLSSASETSLTISVFIGPGNANEFCFRFRFERKLSHHFIEFRIFWILIISVLCLQIFEAIDFKFAGCWMNEWMNERKNQIVRGFMEGKVPQIIFHMRQTWGSWLIRQCYENLFTPIQFQKTSLNRTNLVISQKYKSKWGQNASVLCWASWYQEVKIIDLPPKRVVKPAIGFAAVPDFYN